MPDLPRVEGGPAVLVVDDHRESRLIAAKVLGALYHVETASNGQDAIDLFKARHFDVVLLDIQMPGQFSGIDVLRRLRALPDFQVPVVAFTAYVMPEHRERYAREGFDALIKKPYTLNDLRETVGALVP